MKGRINKAQHIKYLDEDIARLLEELKYLNIERSELTKEANTETETFNTTNDNDQAGQRAARGESPKRKKSIKKELEIGDRVTVLSNHKGRKGCKGTIVRNKGTTQFVLELDHGERCAVWKHNLKKINQ